jgi:SAM-dependent methyltransferase
MKPFSADWLAAREPHDARARNPAVLDALAAAVAELSSIAIVDLGCGTGSALRAIAPRLPVRQHWHLIDNDLGLLERAARLDPPSGVMITTKAVDLVRDLEATLDGPVDLVTASALFDLVSGPWLERFVLETAARRLPAYIALTHDDNIAVEPSDPLDDAVIAAVRRHQVRDKGFGPALGPGAAKAAVACFERAGYRVTQGRSDWRLAPDDRGMQTAVLEAWAGAAGEAGALPLADAAGWLTRRRDLVAAGRSALRLGHVDFLALPDGRESAAHRRLA